MKYKLNVKTLKHTFSKFVTNGYTITSEKCAFYGPPGKIPDIIRVGLDG